MTYEHMTKPAYFRDWAGRLDVGRRRFVAKLWEVANARFPEIAALAKPDPAGRPRDMGRHERLFPVV
jgi:hypothetical protein